MSSVEVNIRAARRWPSFSAAFRHMVARPRPYVYGASTALVVAISILLGKEMMWDTLAYHVYAGYSALHDRFAQDYFAAGSQSYFNPYVYVPFYILIQSHMPAFLAASILALGQAVILWLTYELAIELAPACRSSVRLAVGVCAVGFALANPILINQFGSSYSDAMTGELALAGWLLLVRAIRTPKLVVIVVAGMLLGATTALKPTNAFHAASACVLPFFIPVDWRRKLYCASAFVIAVGLAFLVVAAPWALVLERHFGNPFFPLLNEVFKSPEFPLAHVADYRFIPSSIAEALWRPFEIIKPVYAVDDEVAAPDLRYAVLLVAAILVVARWLWRNFWKRTPGSSELPRPSRALVAVGCGFTIDWTLWLLGSGNGRYFIAMACVAAALCMALIFRLFAAHPKLRNYALIAIFAAQTWQLSMGAQYRVPVKWDRGPWLEVSAPPRLVAEPTLYFLLGEQSMSFVAPFLGRRSGFINLDGDYALGPGGANGAHVRALIAKYSPHLRVIVQDKRVRGHGMHGIPDAAYVNDALEPFGLGADESDCETITVRGTGAAWQGVNAATLPIKLPALGLKVIKVPVSPDSRLVTCRVVPRTNDNPGLVARRRAANLVFDRLEDACPELFQPRRPVTEYTGDQREGYVWMRKYTNTDLTAVISYGSVKFVDSVRGGPPVFLGPLSRWENSPPALECWRQDERYFARVARTIAAR